MDLEFEDVKQEHAGARTALGQLIVGASHLGRRQLESDSDQDAGASGMRRRCPDVPDADEEDTDADSVQQVLLTGNERCTCVWLLLSSVLDMFVSLVMATFAFYYGYSSYGSSLWSLGVQAISHWLGSAIVVLRFAAELSFPDTVDPGSYVLLRKKRRRFLVREQIAAIIMGLVMLLSAVALLFNAFLKLSSWDRWYDNHSNTDVATQWATEFLSWYGFSFYLLQAVFRFAIARRLRRSVVWHAFWSSVVSLVFLFALGFSASYQKEWSWKAEPIVAIGLTAVTLIEAIRIIIMHLDDMDTRLRFDPRA